VIGTVQQTVAARFPPLRGRRVLVAASGGADSTALALALKRLGCNLVLAHVHHGIRGNTAAADVRFVRALARKLGAPFHLGKFDVPTAARQSGESLEMAARRIRRDFLLATARRERLRWIATGHTADDQAETILMRIVRGTSVAGLAGIPYASRGSSITFIRPLRDVTRAQVIEFLTARKQRWRSDETNADDFALRNRVRHEVIPLLEKRLNPSVRQSLLRLGDIAAAEDDVMAALALQAQKCGSPQDLPLAIRRRLALQALHRQGLPPQQIDFAAVDEFSTAWKKIFHAVEKSSKSFPCCGKPAEKFSMLWKNPAGANSAERPPLVSHDPVSCEALARAPHDLVSWVNKVGVDPRRQQSSSAPPKTRGRISPSPPFVIRKGRGFSRRPDEICLSAAAVGDRDLIFRSWRPGDRMKPLGMTGSKKISDIFTDLKIPRAERNARIIVECGGQIAALSGWRVARDFAVEAPRSPSIRIQWKPKSPSNV